MAVVLLRHIFLHINAEAACMIVTVCKNTCISSQMHIISSWNDQTLPGVSFVYRRAMICLLVITLDSEWKAGVITVVRKEVIWSGRSRCSEVSLVALSLMACGNCRKLNSCMAQAYSVLLFSFWGNPPVSTRDGSPAQNDTGIELTYVCSLSALGVLSKGKILLKVELFQRNFVVWDPDSWYATKVTTVNNNVFLNARPVLYVYRKEAFRCCLVCCFVT